MKESPRYVGVVSACLLLGTLATTHCNTARRPETPMNTTKSRSNSAFGSATATSRNSRPSAQPKRTKPEVQASFVAAVHGMAFSPDGTLYFSDSFGQLATTRRIYSLPSPYTGPPVPTDIVGKTPAGLAWFDDSLWICDVKANTVRRFDATLVEQSIWTITQPWNVASGPKGRVIATTNKGAVFALEPDKTSTQLFSDMQMPFGVSVGADGIWLSEQGAGRGQAGIVSLRTDAGKPIHTTQFPWKTPEGLTLDNDGNLWVLDTESGTIVRIDGVTKNARIAASGLSLPVAMAKHPDGSLWFNTGGPTPQLWRLQP